jgi:hypothetical protein
MQRSCPTGSFAGIFLILGLIANIVPICSRSAEGGVGPAGGSTAGEDQELTAAAATGGDLVRCAGGRV